MLRKPPPPPPAGLCKHRFYDTYGGRYCAHNAKRDGFCGTHHPDAEKARKAKSDEKARLMVAGCHRSDAIYTAKVELLEAAIASADWRSDAGFAHLADRLNRAVVEYRRLADKQPEAE